MPPDFGNALLDPRREPFDPGARSAMPASAEALERLLAGDVDQGMPAALRCLAEDRADGALLRLLRENPFLRAALAPPNGYEGDPTVIDLALGVAALPPDTTALGLAMYRWMAAHGTTFAAFQARRCHLAARLDLAGDRYPGAAAVGLFAGHGRELSASRAWRQGRVGVQLVDFDARVLARARHDNAAWGQLGTREGTLAEILAGRLALADCALVYAPTVAEHLPDNTLSELIAALVPALRPGGELLIPAFTRLPEPGLLELAAQWEPNTRSLARLRALARGLDDAVASIHDAPALGIACLQVQRRPRDVDAPASLTRAAGQGS
jgi:SAM-dependent methyltransferase